MTAHDLGRGALDIAPPVGYVALKFGGVPLPEWAAFFAIAYTVMRMIDLAWTWAERRKERRAAAEQDDTDDEPSEG